MTSASLHRTQHTRRSWGGAYIAFLRSSDENLVLKAAPVLLIIGSPEVILSNLVPVVGGALDVGTFGLTMIVIILTFRVVKKYR